MWSGPPAAGSHPAWIKRGWRPTTIVLESVFERAPIYLKIQRFSARAECPELWSNGKISARNMREMRVSGRVFCKKLLKSAGSSEFSAS
jgi:hypothetical protein